MSEVKKKAGIDVAVLIIFFNRPQMLQEVFNEVKIAKPSRLYLYQDAPRTGRQDDIKNVEKCRNIVSDIDWECEVHTRYQKENKGCDPSEYLAQKWMFETEEMGIILEDDDVPSQSFFTFCKVLLEKYKDDERIYCISGMNHLGIYRDDYADYIFVRNQSIWGWATWRRCIEGWDENISYLDDGYVLEQFYQQFPNSMMKGTECACRTHRDSGIEYYESIGWAYQNCNHMLNIVPTKNLITNIGIGVDGTHNGNSIKEYPKKIQQVFFAKRYELTSHDNLRHPPFVVEDISYERKLRLLMGYGHPVRQWFRGWEYGIRRFIYCSSSERKGKIKRLPKTILGLLWKR